MPIAHIDADIVAYRIAAACQNETHGIACARIDTMMSNMLNACGTDEYRGFISGGENFRYKVDSNYKANRKDNVDPYWRDAMKEYLVTAWECEVTDGIEADDALGIHQTDDTIICSIDKDLKQIPGRHYNFVKDEHTTVSVLEGIQFFYKQMMIGDTTDNIFGVKGIGKVKAEKLISPLQKEEEMYSLVRALYKDDERFLRNGKLLWIMREENGIWQPSDNLSTYYDQLKQGQVAKSETSDQQTQQSSVSTSVEISG
jgi:DNA polymerase-1